MRWESGAQVTSPSDALVNVIFRGFALPSAGTSQTSEVCSFSSYAGSVIEVGRPDESGRALLAQRPEIGGVPAAYVCRGFVCDRPVTGAEALLDLLR